MNQRGFTLLELILVMVIVTITLTVVAPSLRTFLADSILDDTARHLQTICKQARTRAIHEGTPHRLHLDPEAGTYWITHDGGEEADERIESEFGRRFEIHDSITMKVEGAQQDSLETEGSQTTVLFMPDGQTQALQITLTRGEEKLALYCMTPSDHFTVTRMTEDFDVELDEPDMP